jgi:hypothetical protein
MASNAAQEARKLGLRVTATNPNPHGLDGGSVPSRLAEYPPSPFGGRDLVPDLAFNLKVTDVSEITNPFVIFEQRPVSREGVLYIDAKSGTSRGNLAVDPRDYFPWLKKPQDIERRTLKIEVIYRSDLIMCRYLHLNKLFPIEYSKIAL